VKTLLRDTRMPRRVRIRLLVRAYWRDVVCVLIAVVVLAWLLLMGLDVRIGWPA
jgi:hypothetical protein